MEDRKSRGKCKEETETSEPAVAPANNEGWTSNKMKERKETCGGEEGRRCQEDVGAV